MLFAADDMTVGQLHGAVVLIRAGQLIADRNRHERNEAQSVIQIESAVRALDHIGGLGKGILFRIRILCGMEDGSLHPPVT